MIGLNVLAGSVDVEVWDKPADSWGEGKAGMTLQFTLEMVPIVPRTTTIASNDSFRERIESGYTMWLSAEDIARLTESQEFRVVFPTGQKVAFALDGSLEGLLWDMNPLSSFNMGNEVNLKFLRRIGNRGVDDE
ncbi:head closure Hc1 [Gordonia phage Kabluna]|uniref:Head-to-tail stopper n=2 Tax=Kablunavirus TaxID=2948776 RepID=A0A2D1GCK3_9CAUD|nr:head closure Hc1 [Gordonia phage Kabluna]YP_010101159.1 head closure Hc1 [Gordonia phage NosilaM]ATN89556.1 head-to-tail stopper [Gordonia phage Kabluna]QAU07278.1 hypothetical protein SEA_NOSILAM_35 [Gordonia phage NosilaM]